MKKSYFKQSTKVEANSTSTTIEAQKPTSFNHLKQILPSITSKPNHNKPAYILTMFILFFILSQIVLFTIIFRFYQQLFNRHSTTPINQIISSIYKNIHSSHFNNQNQINILILGLDQSSNQRENSLLTDTIMIASINKQSGIHLNSIPRDLWIDSLETKINSLYYYGYQVKPENGIVLVDNVISEITGLKLDYYIILNMDLIKTVINTLGGIDVAIQTSFTDNLYPREIDVNSKDPAILYESISFQKGIQHLDGSTALKYIRSRHSDDPVEGTDEGRENRQQNLVNALLAKLKNNQMLTEPETLGKLYSLWNRDVDTNLKNESLIKFIVSLKDIQSFSLISHPFPIETPTSPGLIYHPKKGPDNQWVYLPHDPTWSQLHQFFKF